MPASPFILSANGIQHATDLRPLLHNINPNADAFSLELDTKNDSIYQELIEESILEELFVQVLSLQKLQYLHITCHHRAGNEAFYVELFKCIGSYLKKATNLVSLELTSMPWTSKFATDFATCIRGKIFMSIKIERYNQTFSQWDQMRFYQLFGFLKTDELKITSVPLSQAELKEIAEMIESGRVQKLYLSRNSMDNTGLQYICEAMKHEKNNLTHLSISENEVSLPSLLLDSLENKNNKLQYLSMVANTGLFWRLVEVQDNTNLKELVIGPDIRHQQAYFERMRGLFPTDKSSNRKLLGNIQQFTDALMMPPEDPKEYLRQLFQSTAIMEYKTGYVPREFSQRIEDINNRVNSKWFRILMLLLNYRTRPPLYIAELVKPLGLAWHHNEEEE